MPAKEFRLLPFLLIALPTGGGKVANGFGVLFAWCVWWRKFSVGFLLWVSVDFRYKSRGVESTNPELMRVAGSGNCLCMLIGRASSRSGCI